MTTRKTLRDFFQSKRGTSQDKITYKISNDDLSKDVISDESLLDFSNESGGLLGDYLNHLTENNKRPIKGGNFKGVSPVRGVYGQSNPHESVDNPFVKQGTQEFAQVNSYSKSGYFEDELDGVIDKIGESNADDVLSTVQGQDLTNTGNVIVNPAGEDNPIVQASQNLLIRNNRFSPNARKPVFKPDGVSTSDFEAGVNQAGTFQVQNRFGEFNNSEFITNLDQIKDLGKSLLLKAGGWDKSDTITESADPNNLELVNSILSKSGMKTVDVDALEAKNSFGFPSDNLGNSARIGKGNIGTEKLSEKFGTIFNQKIYFNGKNYELLKKQAAISFIAVRKSLEIVLDQIENLSIKSREKNGVAILEKVREVTENKTSGKYRPEAIESLDFLKKNLFVKTNYSYFDAVDVGIKIMFGVDSGSDNENDIASKSKFINSDANYWISVFMSVLRRSIKVMESVDAFSGDQIKNNVSIIRAMRRNSIISFMNTLATIGDTHIRSQDGKIAVENLGNIKNIRDIDALPFIPATRVMKTRAGKKNHLNTAWSDSNLPSAYILPLNVIGAAIDMDTLNQGTNPARGMFGSSLADKTYSATLLHGSYNRIPIEVVREMEDRFEAEYVPFYITDMRTNEVIAFNAFLTQLNDQISTSYNEATGYGRMDSIKTYNKTTRTVSFAFKIIATNEQDFDQMWYKINKLVTLFYPQWTEGDTVTKGNIGNTTVASAIFKQPFSQVIGATPVVRVRIGDIIKSNYSRFNLSRVFGAGDVGTNLRPYSEAGGALGTTLNTIGALTNLGGLGVTIPGVGRLSVRDVLLNIYALSFGSPVGLIAAGSKAAKTLNNMTFKEDIANTAIDLLGSELMEKMASGLTNGFVNSVVLSQTINKLVDPSMASIDQQDKYGYDVGGQVFIRIRPEKPYSTIDGEQLLFHRPVLGVVKSKKIENFLESKNTANLKIDSTAKSYTLYRIEIADANLGSLVGKQIDITHSDLVPDYNDIFIRGLGNPDATKTANAINNTTNKIADAIKNAPVMNKNNLGKMTGEAVDTLLHGPQAFMSKFFNPVTRAFETNMGRGLAGTLGGVTFNWLNDDYAWETKFNSRAPIGVDISLTLSVIHDIPPGLDHSGYNRAPLYNVGNIMKEVSGDPNGNLEKAQESFDRQENKIQKRRK